MQGLYQNNAGVNIAANGNYCTLIAPSSAGDIFLGTPTGLFLESLQAANTATPPNGVVVPMLDVVSFYVGTGTAGSVVTFQVAEVSSTGAVQWLALSTPAAVTVSATVPFNGVINGPFLGIRAAVTAFAGAFYLRLAATIRSM